MRYHWLMFDFEQSPLVLTNQLQRFDLLDPLLVFLPQPVSLLLSGLQPVNLQIVNLQMPDLQTLNHQLLYLQVIGLRLPNLIDQQLQFHLKLQHPLTGSILTQQARLSHPIQIHLNPKSSCSSRE